MKKILGFCFSFLIFFIFVYSVNAQQIKDYDVQVKINKDGTINIKEKIIYDFGNLERRGVYRTIPFIKKNQQGKKFILEFKDFQVVDEDGFSYPFQKIKEGEKIKLKIGNPNKTLSGVHTYIISYKISGALTYFSDHDELYWNVIGFDWPVTIEKVKAKILLPEEVKESKIKMNCYTGIYGASEKNCQFYLLPDRVKDGIIFETNKLLNQGEGLTIVIGFPKNIVAVLEPKEYKTFWGTVLGKIIFILITLLIVLWYVFLPFYIIYRWFKYGRDPKDTDFGEVRAWFDPPKTSDNQRFLTPAEVGVLGDETVDLKDISATIVDLARRGYLQIEEKKKGEFWLVKKEKPTDGLLPFEKILLADFFKKGSKINLQKETLYNEVEKVKEAIYQQVVLEKLFPQNPQSVRNKYLILAILALFSGNIFLFLVCLIFGLKMPRKTVEGVKAKNIAFSLRNFLKSQKRQLTFQADKQMFFEQLLPYAIVFGVEKIWAQRFKDLGIRPPEWYQGYSTTSFNSINFVNSLSSSIVSFQSAATPTTSSSGFSSGFSSGGGFSGGGGGGGGGGSW
ncbi:MAG: DUF2207 domain-containing protein [Minisyncoccia bacterium]